MSKHDHEDKPKLDRPLAFHSRGDMDDRAGDPVLEGLVVAGHSDIGGHQQYCRSADQTVCAGCS